MNWLKDILINIGLKGDPGKDGIAGVAGMKGDKGDPGKDGVNGKDGLQGPRGENGKDAVSIDITSLTDSINQLSTRIKSLEDKHSKLTYNMSVHSKQFKKWDE